VGALTDIQTCLRQGSQCLAQGQAREAAVAYAHGAQLEANNAQVHLGLAEANLALGNYSVVQMACQQVRRLQFDQGDESLLARALLNLLERRYERALQDVDTFISHDPSVAYAHALRSYVLRTLGQNYDAGIALARATSLSFGGRFDNCFPPLPQGYTAGSKSGSGQPGWSAVTDQAGGTLGSVQQSSQGSLQRQAVRTRFALSQYVGLITYGIITINVIVYLIVGVGAGSLVDIDPETVFSAGGQSTLWIEATGQYWRIFTAMFLHFGLLHLGLNMLSLFFIGRGVEMVYGKWRYLVIYLGAGIVGGIATYFAGLAGSTATHFSGFMGDIVAHFLSDPRAVSAGASGAIFGVFGALGVFYLMNRRSLGVSGRGAISSWVFWLAINLVWGLSVPNIGITDHMGGLVAGIVLSFLLIPRMTERGT
jgi:membrane associated rhomboid family serine protease